MARLSHWRVWAPGLAALAIVVALLPPRLVLPRWYARERTHLGAVERAVKNLTQEIATREWVSTMRASLPTRPTLRVGSLVVAPEPPITPGRARAWAAALAADQRALFGTSAAAGASVLVVLREVGSRNRPPRMEWRPGLRRHVRQVLNHEAEGWCLVVLELRRDAPAPKPVPRGSGDLGLCGPLAAFGRPGSAVWAPLRALRVGWAWRSLGALLHVEVYPSPWESFVGLRLQQCIRGEASTCGQVLRQPSWSPWNPTYLRDDFIAWLLRRHSAAAFGRFWRAEDSADRAALAAFGASLDTLAMRWARERVVIEVVRQPLMPPGAAFTGLVVAVLALGAAAVAARYRRVA